MRRHDIGLTGCTRQADVWQILKIFQADVMTTLGAPTSPFSTFVWENKTPPRVQFFTWLLVQERIQCRANLVVKNVIDSATCALCQAADEDCNHLLFSCPFVAKVWQDVGFPIDEAEVSTLW
jgi:hypothetical protein